MGSWDLSCHLTRAPLACGADIYLFPILPELPHPKVTCYRAGWAFAGPPIRGRYNDYGTLTDVDENSIGVRWLRAILDDQTTAVSDIISEMRTDRCDAEPLRYTAVDATVYDAARTASLRDITVDEMDRWRDEDDVDWPANLPSQTAAVAEFVAGQDDPDSASTRARVMQFDPSRAFEGEYLTAEQALCDHYPLHRLSTYKRRHGPTALHYADAFKDAPARCSALVDAEVRAEFYTAIHIFSAADAQVIPTEGPAESLVDDYLTAEIARGAIGAAARYRNSYKDDGPHIGDKGIVVTDSWYSAARLAADAAEHGHDHFTVRDAEGRISVWLDGSWASCDPADGTAPWVCIN